MFCIHRTSLILILAVLSCSESPNSPDYPLLNPLAEHQLSIPEPSGITFGENYKSLWIVSDGNNGGIYQTTLTGNTIQKLPYIADDLEGICYDHTNDVLWVAEEQKKEIVKLDINGNVQLRKQIKFNSDSGHGFEGIAILGDGRLWLTHEKLPRMLVMLNQNLAIENQLKLKNARDYSGLHFEQNDSTVWMVSDESERLIKWEIPTNNISIYAIPVAKAEGVATDVSANTVYIVSDKTDKLYLFSINN